MQVQFYAGLDVSSNEVQICVIDQNGNVVGEDVTLNCADEVSAVVCRIIHQGDVTFIAETGTYSTHLARCLRKTNPKVIVFDAFQASRFLEIRRHKTDRNDAKSLADLARLSSDGAMRSHLRQLESQHIRSQLALRQSVVEQRVSLENAFRSTLQLNGGRYKRWTSTQAMRDHVAEELARLGLHGTDVAKDLLPLIEICDVMRRHVRNIDYRMAKLAQSIDTCQRWMEIPGVGPIVALSFYTAVDDPSRFNKAQDVGPFFGLTPRVRQSGATKTTGFITKRGDRRTRTLLATAASSAMRVTAPESSLKLWALEVKERRGYSRARVALARKVAILMLSMWKSGDTFRSFTADPIS